MAITTIPVQVGSMQLLMETTTLAGSQPTSRLSDVASRVVDAFAEAQQAIVEVAVSTAEAIEAIAERAHRPDRLEVDFGLKVSAQGNIIVAGASGEATLKVKLVYNAHPTDAKPEA